MYFTGPLLLVDSDKTVDAVIGAVFSTWPLLLLVLSTAGIAGIIIWILVTSNNFLHSLS